MISSELLKYGALGHFDSHSKNLPIVFVEDIPEEALIPNLVQLYQKTGAVEFFRRRHSSEFGEFIR